MSVNAQSDQGQWTTLTTLPFFPVHSHLLPTGRVMIWPGDAISGNDPRLWNPADQSVTTLAKPGYDLFCSGHAFLADGRLFVAGGHIQSYVGLPKASLYNPFSNTWAAAPDMNAGRWYPTVTTLANGDALVVGGTVDNTIGTNTLPQVYETATNTWRSLTNARITLDLYPMMFLAPNGKVFMAAPTQWTRYLDTSGTGAWSFVASRKFGLRDYGSAVMYGEGKILVLGGGYTPTNTAEVIDLNQPSPTWRFVAPMSIARRQVNATLLPDGTVLVTGGTSGAGFNNTTTPVYPAELWDPATETWRTLASARVPRLYHSGAVLLPDGRVLSTGGNNYPTPEAFSPPYLFKGARPTMSAVPPTIGYGQHFSVQSPEATRITKVTLIRITSVTHAFNMDQRLSALSFTRVSGALDIVAPATANIAPPGHYLLFIVDDSGVPSVGSVVRLAAAAPAATLTSLSPSNKVAGLPAFTLTVNGTGFVAGASVRWNGVARTTTFVNSGQLTAAIAGSDIATAGTRPVTVVNPGAIASNALTFTITTPPPAATLTSLSPSNKVAGLPAFTLTVNGTGFVAGATVRWNGVARTTTFVNSGQLTAAIAGSDIATAGTRPVTVVNPGAIASNALTFTITTPPPAATLTSLSPNSIVAGGLGFTLTVNGTGFVAGASVRWNGAARTTTVVSGSQLTAAILASDIATAGTASVTVVNPGASASNPLPFTVTTTFTLTVTKNGSNSSRGTVTSSPAGIDCGSKCSTSFKSGVTVTLKARVKNDTVFAGWSGSCSGTGTCTVTMSANMTVGATFNPR
jgi:hypothetical protein